MEEKNVSFRKVNWKVKENFIRTYIIWSNQWNSVRNQTKKFELERQTSMDKTSFIPIEPVSECNIIFVCYLLLKPFFLLLCEFLSWI